MTKTKSAKVVSKPPQLYRGAETCDFRPEWVPGTQLELVQLLEACWASDPDELTPLLVTADWLGEHGDSREQWVRVACDLWQQCRELKPGRAGWDHEKAKAALTPVCATQVGWRLSCLWGHLVAWHSPSAWGEAMGRTWVDARVGVVSRSVWWWSLGFVTSQADAAGRQADAAWSQAYAAWSQAYAAVRQAYAAWSQAYAAVRQADAAWSQAYAAGSQAAAAGRQADAAGRQADAAGSQAAAAGSQADAAGSQKLVWRFARSAWELCVKRLPELEEANA